MRTAGSWILKGLCTLMLSLGAVAHGAGLLDNIQAARVMRVCIWPDYYGITYRDPVSHELIGLDITLSQELARELAVRVQYVDSSFATLIEDLLSGRCDVAMFGVGMLPQRVAKLNFTQPYLKSDIYGLAMRDSGRIRAWEDIDQDGVKVAVQGGTFMEPVMLAALRKAKVVKIMSPKTRESELDAGHVDVFMADYPYSRKVLDLSDRFRLIRPDQRFFELPYAYAIKPGEADWLKRLNEFVMAIKRDGRLINAAKTHGLLEIVVR